MPVELPPMSEEHQLPLPPNNDNDMNNNDGDMNDISIEMTHDRERWGSRTQFIFAAVGEINDMMTTKPTINQE